MPHGPERVACVLLAEDDAEMRFLLAHRFRKWGFDVVEAHDGAQLAALLDALVTRRHHDAPMIDLIVSDVRMPGPSGLDALTRLRASDWSTPMILLTGFGDPELHAEAARLGASAVFDKPFDLEDLRSTVDELIRS